MENLVIYASIHHGNTEKVAKAMAEVLNAELVKASDVDITALSKYDLIGFGSGIYLGKHHKSLLSFVDELPTLKNKKAFIFYTSVLRKIRFFHECDKPLKRKLLEKGFNIIGEFSCRGFTTREPLKLIGGASKGRPNKEDLEKARNFATNLLKD